MRNIRENLTDNNVILRQKKDAGYHMTIKYSLMILLAVLFLGSSMLLAQDVIAQEENDLDAVRESADKAFEELSKEMENYEQEEVYDMSDQNFLEKEDTVAVDTKEETVEVRVWDSEPESISMASTPVIKKSQADPFVNSFTDIVYKRTLRQPASLQENPANLGIEHESTVSLSLIAPIVNMDFQLSNGAVTVGNYNDFVSRDMLTFEDREYFAGLFEGNGLPIYSSVSLPTLFALRVGSVFFNSGVHVGVSGTLPGEILVIPFLGNQAPGFSFGNPITNMKSSAEVYAYIRNSLGIGHSVSQYIPVVHDFVDLRVGLALNAYMGAFSSAKASNVVLGVDETSVLTSGTAMYSYVNPDADIEVPGPTFGFDFGVGVKLKDFLPMPFVENRVDVQLSFLDVGATVKSSNMIKKEYRWDARVEDPVGTFSEDNLEIDSLLNATHVTLDSNFVMTEKLASRMKLDLKWQPVPVLMVRTGLTAFLNEGLGYEESPRTYFDLDIFPVKWLMLNLGTGFTNGNGYLKTGLGFNTRIWDMGIYTYSLGSAGFTDNIRGFGFKFVNNWYF
jgi:hypothetical protein